MSATSIPPLTDGLNSAYAAAPSEGSGALRTFAGLDAGPFVFHAIPAPVGLGLPLPVATACRGIIG